MGHKRAWLCAGLGSEWCNKALLCGTGRINGLFNVYALLSLSYYRFHGNTVVTESNINVTGPSKSDLDPELNGTYPQLPSMDRRV